MKLNLLAWIAAALVFAQPAVLGCRGDDPDEPDLPETVGEETEEAAEDTGEATEEAADDVGDAFDEAEDEVDQEL